MKYLSAILVIAVVISAFVFGFTTKSNSPDKVRLQTGVVVSDVEKSYEFYTKVLGMTKTGTYHVDADFAGKVGATDYKAIDVIDLRLNDEPGEPEYKITKIQDVKGVVQRKGFEPGTRYISIFVNDLSPYLKRIKENKIELFNKIPIVLPGGISVLILHDPDGAMIEIMGPEIKY